MQVAIYIKAPNDANGNPRRGWLVYQPSTEEYGPDAGYVGFIDEEFDGTGATSNLRNRYPQAIELAQFDVSADEYYGREDDSITPPHGSSPTSCAGRYSECEHNRL